MLWSLVEPIRLRWLPLVRTNRKRVLEYRCAGVLADRLLARGWGATTIPLPFCVVILYWEFPFPPGRRLHEWVHVNQDQQNTCWLVSWWRYGVEMLRQRRKTGSWDAAYRTNRFEVEAYAVEAAALGQPEASSG